MLLSLVYLVVRSLLSALAPLRRSDQEREAELPVLRHQEKVLSRRARRPLFRRWDRIPFAAYEPRPPEKPVKGKPSLARSVGPGAAPAQVDVSPSCLTGGVGGHAAALDVAERARRAGVRRLVLADIGWPNDPCD